MIVGSVTSWERGKSLTLMCAISAAGGFISLLGWLLYYKKTVQQELCADANFLLEWMSNLNSALLDNRESHLEEKENIPYGVAPLVKKGFNQVDLISKGESWSGSTGIFPLNHGVFTDEGFFIKVIIYSKNITVQDCNESLPSQQKHQFPVHQRRLNSHVQSTSKQIDSPFPILSN